MSIVILVHTPHRNEGYDLWQLHSPKHDSVALEVGAKVEARLRRLVVADILSSERNSIRWIVEECPKPVIGRNVTHIEPKLLGVFSVSENHLFTPVAEDVAGKAWAVL